MDSYNSNHIGKAIVSSWHSALVRKSADVRRVEVPPNAALTNAYYDETVRSLHQASSQADAMEIAEDFSEEVLLDTHLKDVFFRSRELLMTSIALLKYTLTAPPDYNNDFPSFGNLTGEREREDQEQSRSVAASNNSRVKGSGSGLGSGPGSRSGTSDAMSMERRNKLKMIALRRLKLAFVILKALYLPTLPYLTCVKCLLTNCLLDASVSILLLGVPHQQAGSTHGTEVERTLVVFSHVHEDMYVAP